jgi:hypothetical protein
MENYWKGDAISGLGVSNNAVESVFANNGVMHSLVKIKEI